MHAHTHIPVQVCWPSECHYLMIDPSCLPAEMTVITQLDHNNKNLTILPIISGT